jgi:hypothetical protein
MLGLAPELSFHIAPIIWIIPCHAPGLIWSAVPRAPRLRFATHWDSRVRRNPLHLLPRMKNDRSDEPVTSNQMDFEERLRAYLPGMELSQCN